MPDAPFGGGSVLPKRRRSSGPWPEGVAEKWDAWSSMPHAKLWQASDWQFAMDTIEIAAAWIDGGTVGLATELRNREKVQGTTLDYRRDLRIGYTEPASPPPAGGLTEPRPVPGPLSERSDLMTQKICFDCFHKLFPDKPIRKITLGRQCVVCKAQTDRTEQMIPVEAEDIPLVKQIAQVPRRVLHRTERHADRRVAVRVAARGAGRVAGTPGGL